ncbi:MAG TPA: hypothetical protein VKE22_03200 [Haliangiales bacterium]|nr:hypothetical protein [Haliangiales bacterium]
MRARWAIAIAALGLLGGCVAAAAAAAGAGTGIYLTSRGHESVIVGTTENVEARSRAAMAELGINVTEYSSKDGGDSRTLKGHVREEDVTIEMRRDSPTTTKTEVTARKNLVEWDKDYAKEVLNKIIATK